MGRPHNPTPVLDRLAARGTLFETAIAHAPLTAPSHASILTGLTPLRHGVRDNGSFVLAEAITLAHNVSRGWLLHGGLRLGVPSLLPLWLSSPASRPTNVSVFQGAPKGRAAPHTRSGEPMTPPPARSPGSRRLLTNAASSSGGLPPWFLADSLLRSARGGDIPAAVEEQDADGL